MAWFKMAVCSFDPMHLSFERVQLKIERSQHSSTH
eukprot:COSAG03_NODE_21165_length_308_cov_0.674641_1_plen_34_part_10